MRIEKFVPSKPQASRGGKPNGAGRLVFKLASDVIPENISWLWHNRFPHRRLSVLTGPPSLGKSQIAVFLAATVTIGGRWPDGSPCGAKGAVIILSAEDDAADTIKPRLMAAGADCTKVVLVDAVRVPDKDGNEQERCFDLSQDTERLESLCVDKNVALIIIDPISAYFGKGSDSHVNSDVRGLLTPLASLAEKCRVAVIAVTHDRKGGGLAGERTIGSIAFTAAPRAVWAVTLEPSEEGATGRKIFTLIKSNLGPDPGGLAYEIESYRIGSETDPDGIGTSRIKWHEGAIAKTADQLYAASAAEPPKKRDAPERDEAENFLRELLAEGRMPVREIESEAKAAGVAWATVRRARDRLKIERHRDGFGKGGIWYWALPGAAIDAHVAQDREGGEHLREFAIDAQGPPVLKNGERLCKNVSTYGEIPIDAPQVEGGAHSSHPIDAHEPPPIDAHHMDGEEWGLD
jgi:putative DNA primase/helicase